MSTAELADPASKRMTRRTAVSTPDKSPNPDSFTNLVTIEVGPGSSKKTYSIHKDLLCFYSDYFRGAFNGSFKEASEGRLPLPNEEIANFDVFHGFLYTRRLTDTQGNVGADMDWTTIVRAWVFGDKHIVPFFQNLAIDALLEKSEELNVIPTDQLSYIYQHTMANAPLRKVLIDIAAYRLDMEKSLDPFEEERWGMESLVDLAIALYKKDPKYQGNHSMPLRDKCFYHVHAEGEHC